MDLKRGIDFKKAPVGSAEFLAECAKIGALAREAAEVEEKPGTLGMLICEYRKSAVFQDLAPSTRSDCQKIFDYVRPIADTALANFNRPLVVRIRDKAAETKGRRFGNYAKAALSIIFGWGRERGFISDNFASGIKDLRRRKGAGLCQMRNAMQSLKQRRTIMRPAIALMMFTGLGPKDTLTLPRNFAKNGGDCCGVGERGYIATRRAKTDEPVFWPMPGPLADVLSKAPVHTTFVPIPRGGRGLPVASPHYGERYAFA